MTNSDTATATDALHGNHDDASDGHELGDDGSGGRGAGTLLNGVVGGLAAVVLSAFPLSTLLGGALAGYLEGGTHADGARVGAVAGVVALVPVLLALAAALALPVELPFAPAVMVGLALAGGLVYVVGAATLGGVLGAHVDATRR